MPTTWSYGDGQGWLNQQCWSLDERPWRIFPTFLPRQPFVRIYNSTWIWQGILFDERSLYLSTPQWNGISEFPEDLSSVEPVPILAFRAPKYMMDGCSEHTHFSGMSNWTQIPRGYVGLSVGGMCPDDQESILVAPNQEAAAPLYHLHQVRLRNVHWSQRNEVALESEELLC